MKEIFPLYLIISILWFVLISLPSKRVSEQMACGFVPECFCFHLILMVCKRGDWCFILYFTRINSTNNPYMDRYWEDCVFSLVNLLCNLSAWVTSAIMFFWFFHLYILALEKSFNEIQLVASGFRLALTRNSWFYRVLMDRILRFHLSGACMTPTK